MKFSKKQVVIGGAAALAIAIGGGAAYAYWSSTGSGSGSATTGTDTGLTVTVDNVNLADLTPGGPADTVGYHVHNSGSGDEAWSTAVETVTGTSNPGCTAADFLISNDSQTGNPLPQAVAAGQTNDETFDIQMIDRPANQDACKGVTVDISVSVS